MNKELDNLRRSIDNIDDDLQRLIVQRARVVKEIAKIKSTSGVSILRPGREIDLLYRLLNKDIAPLKSIEFVNIWREIISTITSSVQSAFSVSVAAPADSELAEETRNYYGSMIEKTFNHQIIDTLNEASKNNNIIGVLPLKNNWWSEDFPKNLNIFAVLPFYIKKPVGFLVGQVQNERSINNKTVVVVPKSEYKISKSKYNLENLASNEHSILCLAEGYFDNFDEINSKILGKFGYIDFDGEDNE